MPDIRRRGALPSPVSTPDAPDSRSSLTALVRRLILEMEGLPAQRKELPQTMDVSVHSHQNTLVLLPHGRLDAFGAKALQQTIDEHVVGDILCVVLDMTDVDYLSSAALRVFLKLRADLSKRAGTIALANLQPYCRDVMDMAGCADTFPMLPTMDEALVFCSEVTREAASLSSWNDLETRELPCGAFRILSGGEDIGAINILGHVEDVLHARISPTHLSSKRFSDTEYSIGLGGLGEDLGDYFGIMGEMITIGGTMVWLPTDGHDTPDFLIPKTDTGAVPLRTAFNASIAGGFNEFMMFESAEADGTTIEALYDAVFALARERRSDYKGVLGLAMRAQMASVFGSGVKRSPVADLKPPNGDMITAPGNIDDWFDCDEEPRYADVTCLICGIGADLSMDLSVYEKDELDSVFCLHPANAGGKKALLHNHAVIFTKLPMPDRAANLDKEVRSVVEDGDFMDMRHLLDSSAIQRAFLGISYTQILRRDPTGSALAPTQ